MPLSNFTPKTAVYLNDACYEHRFIRSSDLSNIVERPERLRAIKIGLSAAIARLEELQKPSGPSLEQKSTEDLISALEKLDITAGLEVKVVDIIKSSASVDILNNAAVKYVHGDINGDAYPEKLVKLVKDSAAAVARGDSEIPEGLSQGDLYLCPGSLNAIQGSLGTVCEAVDLIVKSSRQFPANTENETESMVDISLYRTTRAFVTVRPPGHHCGEDTPSGFCFVNNIAVAAAHAHLIHGITRVAILDIDLHHGNGTQSIAWQINEEAYRSELESESSDEKKFEAQENAKLKIYYGSLHDILSYPCEDGNTALVQAASTSIHGSHGQYIENVHLLPYTSEEHFWEELYTKRYSKVLHKAEEFLKNCDDDKALIMISCGFDACEHEYPSMSRHGRKVPVSFYHRFAVDACALADKHAHGKILSVLEGGYSDRALASGVFAHLCGLASHESNIDESWWHTDNLLKLEKATKKRKSGKLSFVAPDPADKWLERTVSVLALIDTVIVPPPNRGALLLPSTSTSMTLRERKVTPASSARSSPKPSSESKQTYGKAKVLPVVPEIILDVTTKSVDHVDSSDENKQPTVESAEVKVVAETKPIIKEEIKQITPTEIPKKLPRVILRVKDPQETASVDK